MALAGAPPRLAIVGATGAVGGELSELLGGRGFPHSEITLFASEHGAGEEIEIAGRNLRVVELEDPSRLADADVAFLAVPRAVAEEIVRADPGPLLIDLSSAGRTPASAPMVAPGPWSRERVAALRGRRLFAVPHPAASVAANLIAALGLPGDLLGATLLLGASAWGEGHVRHVIRQSVDLLNARLSLEEGEAQQAFNTTVDRPSHDALGLALAAQTQALLNRSCRLTFQIVEIPILHGAGLVLHVGEVQTEQWRERLRQAPSILLRDDREALSTQDAVGQEAVLVSACMSSGALALWCTFDNARQAALTALWIAECLVPALGESVN